MKGFYIKTPTYLRIAILLVAYWGTYHLFAQNPSLSIIIKGFDKGTLELNEQIDQVSELLSENKDSLLVLEANVDFKNVVEILASLRSVLSSHEFKFVKLCFIGYNTDPIFEDKLRQKVAIQLFPDQYEYNNYLFYDEVEGIIKGYETQVLQILVEGFSPLIISGVPEYQISLSSRRSSIRDTAIGWIVDEFQFMDATRDTAIGSIIDDHKYKSFPWYYILGGAGIAGIGALLLEKNTDSPCDESVPPTALCKDVEINLGENGQANLELGLIDGGSSDECSSVNFSLSQSVVTCSDIGVRNIILTVTDQSGNQSTCTSRITITDLDTVCSDCDDDQDPPTFVCPDPDLLLLEEDCEVILPDYSDVEAIDNCDFNVSVSQEPDAGEIISQGITVTLTASDNAGNVTTCTLEVSVVDEIPPSISCQQDITVFIQGGGEFAEVVLDSPSVDDNCAVSDIINDQTDNLFSVGETIVIWTASDVEGNTSTCSQVVTVVRSEDIVLMCQEFVLENDFGHCSTLFMVPPPTISGGQGSIELINNITGDQNPPEVAFPEGQTDVIWSAMDELGNMARCTTIVTVEDTEPPEIICPDDIVVESGMDTMFVSVSIPQVDDNCEIDIFFNDFTNLQDASGFYPAGHTEVEWFVLDKAGNLSTCIHLVTINVVKDTCEEIQLALGDVIPPTDPFINDGIILFFWEGGTPPFTVYFESDDIQEVEETSIQKHFFVDLEVGTYSIQVEDAEGCLSNILEVILEPGGVTRSNQPREEISVSLFQSHSQFGNSIYSLTDPNFSNVRLNEIINTYVNPENIEKDFVEISLFRHKFHSPEIRLGIRIDLPMSVSLESHFIQIKKEFGVIAVDDSNNSGTGSLKYLVIRNTRSWNSILKTSISHSKIFPTIGLGMNFCESSDLIISNGRNQINNILKSELYTNTWIPELLLEYDLKIFSKADLRIGTTLTFLHIAENPFKNIYNRLYLTSIFQVGSVEKMK